MAGGFLEHVQGLAAAPFKAFGDTVPSVVQEGFGKVTAPIDKARAAGMDYLFPPGVGALMSKRQLVSLLSGKSMHTYARMSYEEQALARQMMQRMSPEDLKGDFLKRFLPHIRHALEVAEKLRPK